MGCLVDEGKDTARKDLRKTHSAEVILVFFFCPSTCSCQPQWMVILASLVRCKFIILCGGVLSSTSNNVPDQRMCYCNAQLLRLPHDACRLQGTRLRRSGSDIDSNASEGNVYYIQRTVYNSSQFHHLFNDASRSTTESKTSAMPRTLVRSHQYFKTIVLSTVQQRV